MYWIVNHIEEFVCERDDSLFKIERTEARSIKLQISTKYQLWGDHKADNESKEELHTSQSPLYILMYNNDKN